MNRITARWTSLVAVGIVLLAGLFLPGGSASAKTRAPSHLDLEPSLRSAALVVAVRVEDVSTVRVVSGGKGAQTLHQYAFTPVRVLKGVYSRQQLLLTSADLQPYTWNFDPADVASGQYRLLLLGRSTVGYYGIHPGASAGESLPKLSGPDDPLLDAALVLLELQEERDRLEAVMRLSRELHAAKARGAVALLEALDRRRYLAAQRESAFEAVYRQLSSGDARVLETAARVLGDLLEADYLGNENAREAAVDALVAALRRPDVQLAARVEALGAMASAADAVPGNQDAVRLVGLDAPYDTLAERAARLEVLGRLHARNGGTVAEGLSRLLAGLPLDAPEYLQQSAAQAWARVAGTDGARKLLERLERKKSIGLHGVAEIEAFGLILPQADDPWPLQSALLELDLAADEKQAFVKACEENPSPRLVSVLSKMLDPRAPSLRRAAADLLMKIDTVEAAQALRPHISEEPGLDYKLEIAAFLGRHGFDDGYAYALEHMSDPRYLEAAVVAIGATGRAGGAEQFLGIYRMSNDVDWKRAAVRSLGLLGYEPFTAELTRLTEDLDHPLAAPAIRARADLGDVRVLGRLPAAMSSRNETLVVAAVQAAGTLLSAEGTPATPINGIREALRTLAADSGGSQPVRRQALESLVDSTDAQLDRVLAAMLRDARLEDSELLERVRELAREHRVRM